VRREEQVRVIRALMDHIDRGTTVDEGVIRTIPVTDYTSPERATLEWEAFFTNHPQMIGLSGDLPRPGTFITSNDFGVPLLATRAADGRFRAFANVCRHRGTILETAPRGDRTRFVCPFHAWTFDNTGALIGVPKSEHFGEIDKACHGLVELPAEERHGLLWVHPKPEGQLNAAEQLDGLDGEFEAWDFASLVHLGDDTYETPMNWKLAIDTFGETYHFETLQRDTLAPVFHGNVQLYDTYGRNHRMALCTRSIEMMRSMPEREWHVSMGAFPVYYLFPNVQINVGHAAVIVVRVYPDQANPHRSLSRISFYARPDAVALDPQGTRAVPQRFAEIIRDEDYVAAAAAHRGARSGLVEHFLFGRNEPALHHYHRTYRATLGLAPLETVSG